MKRVVPTGRTDLPDELLSEEDKFEKLSPAERQRLIDEAALKKEWYGFCQGCGFKIMSTLEKWPDRCPECGYGPGSK